MIFDLKDGSTGTEAAQAASFPEFVWIWNAEQGLGMPGVHRRIAEWLGACWTAGDRRLLLMAFRACGKSTLVGLFAAWLLYRKPELRILVLSAEQELAEKMVRNIRRVIERHPLTTHLKPARTELWGAMQFTVERRLELRDPSLLARGIGANATGARADIVICDDVEVPNTSDSPAKRADLRERLKEVDYILTPGGMQLFVGTPHCLHSIYANEPNEETGEEVAFLDGFTRLEIPILDAHGNPQWPERYGPDEVEALRRRHGPLKFESQMMLRPVSPEAGYFDPARLLVHDGGIGFAERNGVSIPHIGERPMVSASAWWDPAFADSKGDRSIFAAVFTDVQGEYWIECVRVLSSKGDGGVDPARTQCRQVADEIIRLRLPSVMVETNGIGRFLPGLLRSVPAESGIPCAVVERHNTKAKADRIIAAFDAPLAARSLHVAKDVLVNGLAEEMREWSPGKSAKGCDDMLDAVAGCLLSEPVRLRRNWTSDRRYTPWRGATAQAVETGFDPLL